MAKSKSATLKGELKFKKLSQGIARFEIVDMEELVGNGSLTLSGRVLGDFDPVLNEVSGNVEITVHVK